MPTVKYFADKPNFVHVLLTLVIDIYRVTRKEQDHLDGMIRYVAYNSEAVLTRRFALYELYVASPVCYSRIHWLFYHLVTFISESYVYGWNGKTFVNCFERCILGCYLFCGIIAKRNVGDDLLPMPVMRRYVMDHSIG